MSGTASYLEAASNGFYYYKKEYLKTNKILKERYSELYDILLSYFKNRTTCNVEFKFSLPGFHIFKCNRIFSLPVASLHSDLQYLQLKFDENVDIDYKKHFHSHYVWNYHHLLVVDYIYLITKI